jgi:hypothetical protein
MAARFRLYLPDGVAAVDAEGVEGETAADAAGADAEADVAPACRTKQTLTSNPAEKAWIHQNRSEEKDKSPKRKVAVRFAGAMRTPWTRLTTTKVFLAMTMKAFRPRNPMPRTPRLPARERNSRTDRPWLTWI